MQPSPLASGIELSPLELLAFIIVVIALFAIIGLLGQKFLPQ